MERYLAVDSGKHSTKVALYDPEKKEARKFKFRTKMSEGFFEDDNIETASTVVEIGGKVYKIGNGAKQEAELETTKMLEIHRVCTLAAIAMVATPYSDESSIDKVHIAIGIPVKDFELVQSRNEYREFILPSGIVEVKLKSKNEQPPCVVKFEIVTKLVCPESSGVLYLNPVKYRNTTTGIVDLGNLNINGTIWDGFDLRGECSLTGELGGHHLISGLSEQLSAEFSRCDTNLVANILMKPLAERHLTPKNANPDIEKSSGETISKYLLEHVKKIKRQCDAKRWSLDFINLVFVGGTTKLISKEIKEVFGEDIYIAEEPEYANVLGFLTKLCSKKLNVLIPAAKELTDRLVESENIPTEEVA